MKRIGKAGSVTERSNKKNQVTGEMHNGLLLQNEETDKDTGEIDHNLGTT